MTDETRYGRRSRRRFLSVAGGTLLGATSLGAAQQTTTSTAQPVQRYRFGGEVQAWQGRAPQSIQGQSNPSLQLSVGQVYEVTWENLDGQPHNFALQNEDGQNLAVIFPNVPAGTAGQGTTTTTDGTATTGGTVTPPDDAIAVTETVTEQGATQTLRFVVTPEVAQYICTIHPTTMVGDVETQGNGGGGNGGNGGQGNGNGGMSDGGGQGGGGGNGMNGDGGGMGGGDQGGGGQGGGGQGGNGMGGGGTGNGMGGGDQGGGGGGGY